MSKTYIADKPTLDKVLDKCDMILGNLMVINDDEVLKTKVAANYFNTKKNGKVFSVFFNDFSISSSPTGTRKNDAENMIARASTDSTAARNDFDEYAIFNGLTVNGYVDTDGEFVVTYFEGEDGFSKTENDTYILFGTSYCKIEIDAYGETISLSDTQRDGYFPMGGAVKTDNSSIRAFIPIAKYYASTGSDGNPASVSGAVPMYSRSENANISTFHAKGTQYCATTAQDINFLQTLFQVVFATRNTQSIMAGATSYYLQYNVAVAESGVNRVIVTTTQGANLVVGSCVSVGDLGENSSTDRGQSYMHSLANRVNITSIESVTIDGTTYSAVYLDCDEFDTTTTTYISTMPWHTGACDDVLGTCGSPVNNTNGKYPFILFGVEMSNGQYEVAGNVLYKQAADDDGNMIGHYNVCYDCVNLANSVTDDYVEVGFDMPGGASAWKYVSELGFDENNPCVRGATALDATSSTGYCDGNYMNNTAGTYEVLLGGHLNYGATAGLFFAYLNYSVSIANWYISARLSATGRSGVISA